MDCVGGVGLTTIVPDKMQTSSQHDQLSPLQAMELAAISEKLNASAVDLFSSLSNSTVESVLENLEEQSNPRLSSQRPVTTLLPGQEEDYSTRLLKRRVIPLAALDGGGARGIVSTCTIKHIENETKTNFSKLFPVAGGSSAGGIVVAGLGMPSEEDPTKPAYTAENLIDIFQSRAPEIFPAYASYNPYGWYHNARSWLYPEFGREGLHKVLLEYFKDKPLSSCINEVVIPAAEVKEDKAWIFTTSKVSVDPRHCIISPTETRGIKAIDVLEATSAAPSFFYPKAITIGKKERLFADAALFANNPSTVTLCEAMSIYGHSCEYVLCSFGTGSPIKELVHEEQRYGKIYWGPNFPVKSIRTTEDMSLMNASTLLNCHLFFTGEKDREEQNLYIFSPNISEKDYTVADTTKEHTDRLIQATLGMIEERHDEIRTLCKKLTAAHGIEFD